MYVCVYDFQTAAPPNKMDRSVSRFTRHPIEKTDGEFQGKTSPRRNID